MCNLLHFIHFVNRILQYEFFFKSFLSDIISYFINIFQYKQIYQTKIYRINYYNIIILIYNKYFNINYYKIICNEYKKRKKIK